MMSYQTDVLLILSFWAFSTNPLTHPGGAEEQRESLSPSMSQSFWVILLFLFSENWQTLRILETSIYYCLKHIYLWNLYLQPGSDLTFSPNPVFLPLSLDLNVTFTSLVFDLHWCFVKWPDSQEATKHGIKHITGHVITFLDNICLSIYLIFYLFFCVNIQY